MSIFNSSFQSFRHIWGPMFFKTLLFPFYKCLLHRIFWASLFDPFPFTNAAWLYLVTADVLSQPCVLCTFSFEVWGITGSMDNKPWALLNLRPTVYTMRTSNVFIQDIHIQIVFLHFIAPAVDKTSRWFSNNEFWKAKWVGFYTL